MRASSIALLPIIAVPLLACSGGEKEDGPTTAVPYDETKCAKALAFSMIPVNYDNISLLREGMADIELPEGSESDYCSDEAFSVATRMMRDAITGAGFLEEEFREFSLSKTMSTGSVSEPAACYEMEVSDKRTICELPVVRSSDSGISATWEADSGDLLEVDGTGKGFVDYENPRESCSKTPWTLETCGGVFSQGGEYVFALRDTEDLAVKSMIALCGDTYYEVPVCDDYLAESDTQGTLCGTDFCVK